ncbi:MAG: calcium/sodium antiporter [Bacteroidales bacterium]|nr:calcium/sodium antiporter [Bacteroidales bacterium]
MLNYFILLAGFVLLIGGADYLVKGASSIAKKLNVSDLIIGLTIVSIGTSAPELAVNILASFDGSAGMAIGNVVGSNLFNFLVIIGISAMIKPINLKTSLIKVEIPFTVLASLALIFLAGDWFIDGMPGMLTRSDGLVLLLFFSIFLYYVFLQAKKGDISPKDTGAENTRTYSTLVSSLMVLGGIGALIYGGDLIVKSATQLAKAWGMSDTVIGLTIVAVGTSLPELATSAVAAMRGNSDIAIGNVVGSNIFNIFMILGISSTILPLPFANESMADTLVATFATILVMFFAQKGKSKSITRTEGAILMAIYIIYLIYLLNR